jgi:hypothetical protein
VALRLSRHHPASPVLSAAVDEKAIRRAALITPRRAILERFQPGAKRAARDHYANGWRMRAESLAYARWGMPFSGRTRRAS